MRADDCGSASGHRGKRASSDSNSSTVTKRQRQSATQRSGDSSSGNMRGSRGKGKAKKLAAVESDISGDKSDGAQDEITSEQALQREIDHLREQNAGLTDAVDATVVQLRTSLAHCNVLPPQVMQQHVCIAVNTCS